MKTYKSIKILLDYCKIINFLKFYITSLQNFITNWKNFKFQLTQTPKLESKFLTIKWKKPIKKSGCTKNK